MDTIEFSPEFFLDEVRDGFYVPSMMKRAFAVCLQDYHVLEQTCDSHNLHINVIWGTILGAVRHGGFIPWDDDIDTEMIRSEYMELATIAKDGRIPDNYCIRDYTMDGGDNLVKKWLDSPSLVKEPHLWKDGYGFPFASNIDIMMLDYIPEDEGEHEFYMSVAQSVALLVTYVRQNNPALEEELSKFEDILGINFDRSDRADLIVQLQEFLDNFALRYTSDICDRLAELPYYIPSSDRVVPKRLYADYIDMHFESTTVRVPIGYDGILRRYWGNYMYPRIDFVGHAYPFYKVFEQKLRDMHGIELVHYHYYDEQARQKLTERVGRISITDRLMGLLPVLVEAHDYIITYLSNHIRLNPSADADTSYSPDEALSILEQCQNMAISFGELCERKLANSTDIVAVLENYCDIIYRIHELIATDTDDSAIDMSESKTSNIKDELYSVTGRLREFSSGDLSEKKEIVFIVLKSSDWNSLHTLWQRAMSDDMWNVTVIPTPYYYRDFEYSIVSDKPVLDTASFPEEVELTAYDAYDFETLTPDIIVVQSPFDEYSDAFSIHPFYYTSNLRQYTDKLVLIPSFTLREVEQADERSRFTLRSYVETPGWVYADMIVVQSENMKNVFLELALEFIKTELGTNEYNKSDYPWFDWEAKIIPVGSPIYDWDEACSHSNVHNSSKVIAYQIIGSMLYEHGIAELERAKSAINLIISELKVYQKEQSYLVNQTEVGDINPGERETDSEKPNPTPYILIAPDPYIKKILKKNTPDVWSSYQRFIRWVESEEYCVIDTSSDYRLQAETATAYYGDACLLMNECRILGKPVLHEVPGTSLLEDETYEYKRWLPESLVLTESEMSLHNFIKEALNYEPPTAPTDNSTRIWDALTEE